MEENKKTEVQELSEKLLMDRAKPAREAALRDAAKAMDFAEGYKDFITAAKTEREAVDWTVTAAKAAGFTEFDPMKKYSAGDKVYYNNRGKAMCLAVIGKNGAKDGVRIAAAHIDSPRIDLKPIPMYESGELALLKTHYYGGIKKYQWTAIPLSLHGKIVKKDGTEVILNVGENPGDPQFCITDILPHLGKDQTVKKLGEAFTGEDPATDIGFDRSMVGAYGHDDRVCAYPAVQALFASEAPEKTAIVCLADKEEIGSVGNTGLCSEYLNYFVCDLARAEGLEPQHVWSKSNCLSADVTAAFDPTYASAYEPGNSTYVNRGVGIAKYTGSRGKGGSNDASAEFLGWVRRVLDNAGVLWQIGELGKVDQGGGGTVALDISRLNADVIDIGVPVLSMHAPFEVISKVDLYAAYQAFKAYFEAE